MEISAERYADWKAPRADGEVLIWPSGDELIRQTRDNTRRLSSEDKSRVQGVALGELRGQMRRFIGHDDSSPLVGTGHQTELAHPGVWVKNVLINRIAEAAGGQSYLFAVDTDEPKHLNLRWPGMSLPITDDPRMTSASWSGQLAPPTPEHLSTIESTLDAAQQGWNFRLAAGGFIHSMRRLSLEAETLAPTLVNALHELDWSLGLRHHALVVSPMFQAEPYLLFVHHLMARADEVATNYNQVLAEYRREQGIRTPGRPMPDLRVMGERIESPFWVDDLSAGDRVRASLKKTAGGWSLTSISGDEFVFAINTPPEEAASRLLTWLRRNNLRISTRALTLTTFLRLFLADQFVHGIGGGRYDQVADRFIQKQFGIQPPYFSVTTGTLFFPTAIGHQRVCIPCLLQEGHRAHHAAMGKEKQGFIERIGALPRRSLDRRMAFGEMHRRLKDAAEPTLARWDVRMREARQRAAEEEILFDRELFYAIQPRDRLEMLLSRYADALS
ncbi:MAG TPA: hypothetical protein VFE58_08945 [Tepidisphaeraceae bacterium]|jgi:hypothetical protein|nr:hypothetical protein [Tepidisphaeraceae bacterium]